MRWQTTSFRQNEVAGSRHPDSHNLPGFNSHRDVTVRRTPTVRLKLSVEISLTDFNGDQFAMNLATLLGIPPERIGVATVSGRRLSAGPSTGIEVEIGPSPEAAAAAGGTTGSASGAALDAQASELQSVSSSLSALSSGSDLAAAAGGTVAVESIEAPAGADDSKQETVSTAATNVDTTSDVLSQTTAVSSAAVSVTASCPSTSRALALVGAASGSVGPSGSLAHAASETRTLCSAVNSGYEGDIALSCSAGVLTAQTSGCVPKGCSSAVSVTVGGTTASVTPTGTIASGLSETRPCSEVHASHSGTYAARCSLGTASVDTASCKAQCPPQAVNLTVAGVVGEWSLGSTLASGSSTSAACRPIHDGYEGSLVISCHYGSLSVNPAQCVARPCEANSSLVVTLGGASASVFAPSRLTSGRFAPLDCSLVNGAYSGSFRLACSTGELSARTDDCRLACLTSQSQTLSLGGSSVVVSPSSAIPSGGSQLQSCSTALSGLEGLIVLSCSNGQLAADAAGCREDGCTETAAVSVLRGGVTAQLAPGIALASGQDYQAWVNREGQRK